MTLALCGVWDHDGRCRWPHHSGLHLVRATAVLRTVFVSVPVEEQLVRARIDAQLGIGTLTGPDGRTSSWRLRDTRAADPDPDEAALASGSSLVRTSCRPHSFRHFSGLTAFLT